MPPKAKPKFPFLLLEPSMTPCPNLRGTQTREGSGCSIRATVQIEPPSTTRGITAPCKWRIANGCRAVLPDFSENFQIPVLESSMWLFSRIFFHFLSPQGSICSTSSRVVNLGHAHATMGQNCTLGARAHTFSDLSSGVGLGLGRFLGHQRRCCLPNSTGVDRCRYLRRDSRSLHSKFDFDDM